MIRCDKCQTEHGLLYVFAYTLDGTQLVRWRLCRTCYRALAALLADWMTR